MEGWEPFCRNFEAQLKGSVPYDEWYTKVMLPAFKTCPTHVYKRDSPASKS